MLPGASQQRGWIKAARTINAISNKLRRSAVLQTLRLREDVEDGFVDEGLNVDDIKGFFIVTCATLFSCFFRFTLVDFNLWKEIFKSLSWVDVVSRVLFIRLDIELLGWRLASRLVARWRNRSNCCSRWCGKSLSVDEASLMPLSQEPSPRSADLRPR